MFEPSDMDMETNIRCTEKELDVKIQPDPNGSTLTILALTKASARDALLTIQRALKHKPGQANMWHPRALMQPLMGNSESLSFALQRKQGGSGARPIISTSQSLDLLGDAHSEAAARKEYKEGLKNILTLVADNLRYVPNQMRMRVHFGRFILHEWKKDKMYYTLQELEHLVRRAGPRGTARMDTLQVIRVPVP